MSKKDTKAAEEIKKLDLFFEKSLINNLPATAFSDQVQNFVNDFVDSLKQEIFDLVDKIGLVLGVDKNIVLQAISNLETDSPSLICIMDELKSVLLAYELKRVQINEYSDALKGRYRI